MAWYLIVNTGSTLYRCALYEDTQQRHLFEQPVHQVSPAILLSWVTEQLGATPLTAIGIRLVIPGTIGAHSLRIDQSTVAALEKAAVYAPLHSKPVLAFIKAWHQTHAHIPLFGISDSAFHATMPLPARQYAIPPALAQQYGIYRFGYHGIALRALVNTLKQLLGTVPERVVVCYLGGGSSVTALYKGESIDTSMGFSPLEGAPMMTRVGSFDVVASAYLAQQQGLSPQEWIAYLATQCGMFGMTGLPDMQTILQELPHNQEAADAVDLYVYALQKYIGAFATLLGGLDALVFSGGIGLHSPVIRARICERLSTLGIHIDAHKNAAAHPTTSIEKSDAPVPIYALFADEMKDMVGEVARLCTLQ